MKVASLFAGIGGFDKALTDLGHEIVYVNEWDKYSAQIYEKNFCTDQERQEQIEMARRNNPDTESRRGKRESNARSPRVDTRSITDVSTGEIPDHDLLVGGFPCQAFSVAGKRRGFNDTRGTLFFDVARILKDKRPRYFILENVKGLLSHDEGKTFQTILGVLTDLGYEYQWQVLNSKNFGVPQNRERVFIVGNLRGKTRPQVFPIAGDSGENAIANSAGGPSENNLASTLTVHYTKNQHGNQYVAEDNQEDRYIIHNVYGGFGEEKPREFRDYSPTIRTPQGGGHIPNVVEGVSIRRLTPIECERLQGFPDNWTEGVSDTQRYKQLGNAVTVNVVYEIAKRAWQ